MWRYVTLPILCAAALTWAAAVTPEFDAAYRAGRVDATRDVRNNHLAIEIYGRQAVWEEDYANLALQRYRIHIKAVAGCVVDDQILGHAKGYNEVSESEITRRFGKEALVNLRLEAARRWEENRAK